MTGARPLVVQTAFSAVALVVLLQIHRLSTSRALAIWVVIVATLALYLLVQHSRPRGLRRVHGFEQAMRGRAATASAPVELQRVERELELGIANAASAYYWLLPRLRTAAAARLASHHGIELERRPDAARALLGEHSWELLRPDRPQPADRFGRGVPRATVAALIEQIESL